MALLTAFIVSINMSVYAQSNEQTAIRMGNMTQKDAQEFFVQNPWAGKLYNDVRGRDVDVATVAVVRDELTNGIVTGTETEVFYKARPYTGWKFGVGLGASADFELGNNAYDPESYGATIDIRGGYQGRRLGLDVGLGLSDLWKHGDTIYGKYNISIMPYVTPFRWGKDDQNRFDLGGIVGVQQATEVVYDSYETEDGLMWGNTGRKTTAPRAMVGGLLRYERRQFMGGLRFALEASVVTYGSSASYRSYLENVTTGEVLVDQEASVDMPHVQAQLKLVISFGCGKIYTNY